MKSNTIPKPKVSNGEFICPECGDKRPSQQGYNMHWIRKHSGQGWKTAPNFRKSKSTALVKANVVPNQTNNLHPDNMHVTICPRCRCRYAIMIID